MCAIRIYRQKKQGTNTRRKQKKTMGPKLYVLRVICVWVLVVSILNISLGAIYAELEEISLRDGIFKMACNTTTIGTGLHPPSTSRSVWFLGISNFLVASVYLYSFFYIFQLLVTCPCKNKLKIHN